MSVNTQAGRIGRTVVSASWKRLFLAAFAGCMASGNLLAEEPSSRSTNVGSQPTAVNQSAVNQSTSEFQSQMSPQDPAKEQVPESLDFKVESIDGEQVDLKKYAGKVVVVVNVASRCGYTPQYKSLQKLYETHGDQGLVILGFPCNQFRSQEPGSNSEIKEFCSKEYQVTFDMFAKIDVNGANRAPFYDYLTKQELAPAKAGDISWNFEKFVLGRDGKPIARFGAKVRPDSDEFMDVIKKALAQ